MEGKGPRYTKMPGGRTYYALKDIEEWEAEHPRFRNTIEAAMAQAQSA